MSDRTEARKEHPRSSRDRYRRFVQDYKHQRLDDSDEAGENSKKHEDSAKADGDTSTPESKRALRSKRREHVREYLRWLRPHRYAVATLFVLALLAARPDAVIVEMGLPVWRPPAQAYLVTFGATRASSLAAAEVLGLASGPT